MLTGDDGGASSLFTLPEWAACLWLFLAFVAACRFVEEDWCFSRGCFIWKAGSPWPRQHYQCFSWLRGGGREGCGLFYLISVSTRASVWCKRVGVFFPPFSTLALFSFSLSQICAAPSSYLPHSVLSAGPSLPTLFKSCALTINRKQWDMASATITGVSQSHSGIA